MGKRDFDLSLYLVTGREVLPAGKDYYESLEESLKGGVTIVQVREKKTDTKEFLEVAKKTKEICDKYNVPVLINDRVDIALAIKADGVHVGQDDMPIEVVRAILGPNAIIGVSAGTVAEAKAAVAAGADYLGIGAVYPTGSKSNAKLLGVRGVGPILGVLESTHVKSVVIGGVKLASLLRILHGAVSPNGKHVDGVAVISEIVSSQSPRKSAEQLSSVLQSFLTAGPSGFVTYRQTNPSATDLIEQCGHLLTLIKKHRPMVHQLTNNVVTNQSANATIALGASPIMATAQQEQEDLAKVPGGLLINFGTVSDKEGMLAAGKWANFYQKPVVFDPVGVGATEYRRTTAAELMGTWQATVIKGNAGELASLLGSDEVRSQGVDSVGSGFADPAKAVKTLARRERCIVVLTGKTDYISDGETVVKLDNGHEALGNITGSGCMVGTAVATLCGTASMEASKKDVGRLVHGDMLVAAIVGVLAVSIAAEVAVEKLGGFRGPGSFLAALLDALYALDAEQLRAKAKVTVVAQ